MEQTKTTGAEKNTVSAQQTKAAVYSKSALLGAKKFADKVDALRVCLEDNKTYTMAQAEKILEDFLKRRVTN